MNGEQALLTDRLRLVVGELASATAARLMAEQQAASLQTLLNETREGAAESTAGADRELEQSLAGELASAQVQIDELAAVVRSETAKRGQVEAEAARLREHIETLVVHAAMLAAARAGAEADIVKLAKEHRRTMLQTRRVAAEQPARSDHLASTLTELAGERAGRAQAEQALRALQDERRVDLAQLEAHPLDAVSVLAELRARDRARVEIEAALAGD